MPKLKTLIIVLSLTCLIAAPAQAIYDYATGRFLQQDPLGVTPNAPDRPGTPPGNINKFNVVDQYGDGMNLYEYVKSNPIKNKDPYGLDCVCGPDVTCTPIISLL